MISILLIEDNPRDAQRVTSILRSNPTIKDKYSLTHMSTAEGAISYLMDNTPDLILMDLEMSDEHTTTMSILDQISSDIPVIVISHLSHYQKPSLKHGNVYNFIPKSCLEDRLVGSILQTLAPRKGSEPETISFPVKNMNSISERFSVYKISFIQLVGRSVYEVYLTDGNVQTVHSVLFKDLTRYIKNQHIDSLRPVSRNEIININHISKIKKTPAGRVELYLLGYEDRSFHPGKGEIAYFEEEFF